MKNITDDIFYIGVDDHDIDLFEGQYVVENGMAYNSYVIMDDKIAVMDTVDGNFAEEWLEKLAEALDGRTPDYLIVQHMEPDHSANIAALSAKYPAAVIVASAPAFTMMKNYFGNDYADRRLVIKEGDTLSLGAHTLQFVAAPMVRAGSESAEKSRRLGHSDHLSAPWPDFEGKLGILCKPISNLVFLRRRV